MNVEPFSLPLATPLGTARGTIETREGFLVRVTCDGAVGVGEAAPLPGWTEPLSDCEAALRAVEDPSASIENDRLDGTPAARHAVASALADARARAADQPLRRWLLRTVGADGATDRARAPDAVPVNATVGDDPVDATVAAAERAVAAGFDCVKLKIGARSLTADLDRVAAVRAALPDTELRADANGAWTPGIARRALSQIATHDLAYVEQPLPAAGSSMETPDDGDVDTANDGEEDLAAHAALRAAGTGTAVALDESLARHPVEQVLDSGAADVLVLKPMALGGPDRALAAALAARRAGLTPVVTTTIDGAIARAAAVHVAAAIPDVPACGLATGDRLAADLLDPDPVPVTEGAIRVPAGPGALGETARHAADPS